MNYRDENETMGDQFNSFIEGSMSIRGLLNRYKIKGIKYALQKAKTNMGFECEVQYLPAVENALEVLKLWGIENVMPVDKETGKIISSLVVKLRRLRDDTYVLIYTDNKTALVMHLYFFGKKSYVYYKRFTDKTKQSATSLNIYTVTVSDRGSWTSSGQTVPCRSFDTLYFDNGLTEKIKSHLDTWLGNKDMYEERGLLFKTGLLFYGTAGTGKTSIANAIATYLGCHIIAIDTTSFATINIGEITAAINSDSNMYVVLLDEVDAVFKTRDDVDSTEEQKKAKAKLLSFLDGAQSPTNVVFVATTNYIERLDSALIRKGRFDKEFEVKDFSKKTAIEMCRGFGMDDAAANELIGRHSSSKINPAELQAEILEVIKVR